MARLVQSEIYDFGFEMQESSDFEIPDFLIPDSRFPIPLIENWEMNIDQLPSFGVN